MVKIIPFAPMPTQALKALTLPFKRFSANTGKIFPNLKNELEQSELGFDEREYGAIMIFLVLFYTAFFSCMVSLLLSRITPDFLALGIGIGLVMGLMMLFQAIMYPKILVRKKVRDLEKSLVFALRAILVQLKSGVGLFDSMTMVAKGDYGAISVEFKKAIDAINTGTPEQDALQDMSDRNPSPYLRKSLWQIVNGMNAGADISDILAETVSSMIREQRLAINSYGSQLRVLSLMYMMIGVIMPALGVTLLIILFTFPMVGEAIAGMPILNDFSEILQNVLPGETYVQGDYIPGIGGKQEYSGKELSIKVERLEDKKAVFALKDPEDKTIRVESIYGSGSNLRDYFVTGEGRIMFGESLKIKSVGENIFGEPQVEITRLEQIHLVFWGLLAMIAVMEFMYIGIIKSRRPSIIG